MWSGPLQWGNMSVIASQITDTSTVCLTSYTGEEQRNYQTGTLPGLKNYPHKRSVMRKAFWYHVIKNPCAFFENQEKQPSYCHLVLINLSYMVVLNEYRDTQMTHYENCCYLIINVLLFTLLWIMIPMYQIYGLLIIICVLMLTLPCRRNEDGENRNQVCNPDVHDVQKFLFCVLTEWNFDDDNTTSCPEMGMAWMNRHTTSDRRPLHGGYPLVTFQCTWSPNDMAISHLWPILLTRRRTRISIYTRTWMGHNHISMRYSHYWFS